MIRFLADENFNNDIVWGVLRRNGAIDFTRVQDEDLLGADDPAVLEWAAQAGYIVLTHDVSTMSQFAYDRVRDGKPMPGVFEVGCHLRVGKAIEELLILAECSLPGEWEGQVRHLPL